MVCPWGLYPAAGAAAWSRMTVWDELRSEASISPYTMSARSRASASPGMLSSTDGGAIWCVPKIYDGVSEPVAETFHNSWALTAPARPAIRQAVIIMILFMDVWLGFTVC